MKHDIKKILLVEDSRADAKMLQRALNIANVENELNISSDGEAAWKYLNEQKLCSIMDLPDLILLDLNIPKINGKELLKLIKSDSVLKKIPIVVLTTSSSNEDINSVYKLYANSFITKPVDFEGLVKVIDSINNYWFGVVSLSNKECI